MNAPYEPDAPAVLNLPDGPVPVVVAHDDGGDTVVISYPNPYLEGKTSRVPVLRAFLTPATPSPEAADE